MEVITTLTNKLGLRFEPAWGDVALVGSEHWVARAVGKIRVGAVGLVDLLAGTFEHKTVICPQVVEEVVTLLICDDST